jgi:hypothetical protein
MVEDPAGSGRIKTGYVIPLLFWLNLIIWVGNAGANVVKKLFGFSLFFQGKKKPCTK